MEETMTVADAQPETHPSPVRPADRKATAKRLCDTVPRGAHVGWRLAAPSHSGQQISRRSLQFAEQALPMVTSPSPGTLRLRVALTDATTLNAAVNRWRPTCPM